MKYIKSQTGNTLLFAIMVLMLGSVIALTLIGMSINGTARNEHRENYNQAKKNAESGIEHLIASMEKDLESKIPSPGIDTNHNKTASFRNDFMDILSTYSCPPNEEKDYEKYYIHNKDGSTWYATCVQYDEKENKEYKIKWDEGLIFPQMIKDDKVWVNTVPAKRGSILDKDGNPLAQDGILTLLV
nr:hypothetical protein [Bacilli bacterium]